MDRAAEKQAKVKGDGKRGRKRNSALAFFRRAFARGRVHFSVPGDISWWPSSLSYSISE